MRGGGRSVPPSLPAVPASRSPSLAGGEAMQDRALALGAVGLGGTDEFGLGVEVQKGGAGTPSNVAIFFLCQHGIPLHQDPWA